MRTASLLMLAVTTAAAGAGCGLLLGLDEFVDAPPPGEGGGGGGGAGGAGGVCVPGTAEPCYSGPPGTEGVGVCRAGQRQCNEDGSAFGACQGEVTPAVEVCAEAGDEDCDGNACSDLVWAKLAGDAGYQGGFAVAVDNDRNVFVVGTFSGTMTFGGALLVSASGTGDAFIVKLNAAGEHVWSKRFGGVGVEVAEAVSVNAEGHVAIAGFFGGSINFGGGDLVGSGSYDVFVAKFDALGNHLWSKSFGDAGDQRATGVALGESGNVFVVGHFAGAIDFGNGSLTASGSKDGFVAKLAGADGAGMWSKRVGGALSDELAAIALDSAESVYVGGHFLGSLTLGGMTLVAEESYPDALLVKLDSFGNFVLGRNWGGTGSQRVRSVAVDPVGNVVVAGTSWGTIHLGGAELVSPSGYAMFLAKLTSGGEHQWGKLFGQGLYDHVRVAADRDGNVLVSCATTSAIDWGGGPLEGEMNDTTIAKLSPSGDHHWSKRFVAPLSQVPFGIAVDPSSAEVVVTGNQIGDVDYGLGTLVGAGSHDVFVAKFAP